MSPLISGTSSITQPEAFDYALPKTPPPPTRLTTPFLNYAGNMSHSSSQENSYPSTPILSSTPRKSPKFTVTPRTARRRCEAKRRKEGRIGSKLATSIENETKKLDHSSKVKAIVKALRKLKIYDDVRRVMTVPKVNHIKREAVNLAWNWWIDNSTVSNCNTMRPSTISVKKFHADPLLNMVDLDNSSIETFKDKRGTDKYMHQDQVQKGPDYEIYESFKKSHPQVKIGKTYFCRMKPFFVRLCKPSDITTCCCQKHVNFRNAIEALIKELKALEALKSEDIKQDNFSTYKAVKKYLLEKCCKADDGLLTGQCAAGECTHVKAQFQIVKEELKSAKNVVNFKRFLYVDTEKYGRRLQPVDDEMDTSSLLQFIEDALPAFIQHSNTVFRDYLYWKIWVQNIVATNPLLQCDFAENLSLPIQQEPQSLYWIRKQLSILTGVGTTTTCEEVSKKIYFGYFSEDRDHDQVYALQGIRNALSEMVKDDTKIFFIRSDNAPHFKSAENFDDLQNLSNESNITLARIFSPAQHGKGEHDSAGGHMKTAVRKKIQMGESIKTVEQAVDYLQEKYSDRNDPYYVVESIDLETLESERLQRIRTKYSTVHGSDKLHVMIFTPHSDSFLAAEQLCVCEHCLSLDFKQCHTFR